MELVINGQGRAFAELAAGASLRQLIDALGMKGDRVAVERNGDIVPRAEWEAVQVVDGDRLEIVHFVGGGC